MVGYMCVGAYFLILYFHHIVCYFWLSIIAFAFLDRVNEFSDEDEEIEFSSGEYDPNNIGGNGSGNGPGVSTDHLTGYDAKRDYAMKRDLRKYRKIDPTENDGEGDDGALGANPADSDSEFENLKVKGSSRGKISHVRNYNY